MPKDATKNIDRYKIRGGQLNEFDFHQNQEEFADQQRARATNLIPGTPPEERAQEVRPVVRRAPAKKSAEGLRPVVAKARKPAKKRATKSKKTTKASPRGATAKKLAARKAAKKK